MNMPSELLKVCREVMAADAEKKLVSGIEQAVYDAVLSKAGKYCAVDPDGSVQCHMSLNVAKKELSDYWWFKQVKFHVWNEARWKKVAERLKKDDAIEKFGHRAIRELIEDISDGTVNGHSFMEFRGRFIDPHLKSKGVPDGQIQKFAKYFKEIM